MRVHYVLLMAEFSQGLAWSPMDMSVCMRTPEITSSPFSNLQTVSQTNSFFMI
jgi:hypothetical protein